MTDLAVHAPIELQMNILIINDSTGQRGKANLTLGWLTYKSQKQMALTLKKFEENELQNMAPNFRLMTKEEAFNYAMYEKTGSNESFAIPGGQYWDKYQEAE